MKKLKKHQLIAIGSSIAVLYGVLPLVVFASATSRTEKPAAVDAEQFTDFMGHEILDIQDLAEGAEIQRRMFNRITPPGLSWVQPMFPPIAPFDAQYFDEQFLAGLLGEDKNSVAIYPLSLIQDPQTCETLIYNAEGELIAAIPADRGSRQWPEDAAPSRVILQLDLLPTEDVEPYLYTERRIEESLARHNAPRSAKSGGAATRGLEAGEFGFADMKSLTNGNILLTVTNGADVVEVFAYTVWHTSSVSVVVWTNENDEVITSTNIHWHQVSPAFNGLESAWECLTTNLVLTNGVGVYENVNISSNARIRFYAVANRQDADGDGLTDGMEIFVHHTDPGNPDTDGDGWSDAEELAAETEPLDRFSATKLARDVVLNEVLYNATGPDLGYEWIELYCAGRYPVNLEDFVIQVADAAYSNAYVFPSNTWIEPGRFLLLGGSNVPNRDLEVNFRMPNRFTNDPTAAVRIVAETGTNTVVVDCLMYGGSASNFNQYGLDTTGWISSYALSAGAGRSLYRRFNGHDTDQVLDWWYTSNPTPNPSADIPDSDGDGLTDEEELTGSRNPYGEPTNPHNADSDGDGLSDYAECITHGTNPNTWATDDDIYPWPPPSGAVSDWWGSDSYEIANGWDPLNPDENTNGIPDSWEMAFPGTNLYGHADNDGISNFDELMQNSDPSDPDSHTAQPYVIRCKSSMPGWVNDGMTDIGLEGWVKIYFEGLKTNLDLCVWVKEGRTQEQFRVEWSGATQKGIRWLNDQEVLTSASATTNTRPYLLVQDLGMHPNFTNTLGGEYKVTIIHMDLNAAYSDQISGRECNALPGQNPMYMGARADNRGYLQIDAMILPQQIYNLGLVGVRHGTDVLAGVPIQAIRTPIDFAPAGGRELYEVVAGYDLNTDGTLQNLEVSEVLTDQLMLLTQGDYNWSRGVLNTGAFFPGIGGDLLDAFIGDTVPLGANSTSASITAAALTHPLGAEWTASCDAQTRHYTYAEGSTVSDAVETTGAVEGGLRTNLDQHQTEVRDYFVQNPTVNEHTFGPWIWATNNVEFGEIAHPSLHFAFGHVSIAGTVSVTVRRSDLEVTSIQYAGSFDDIYDFAYNGAYPSIHGTTVQAGFPTLGIGGRVFWTRVEFERQTSNFDYDFN
jgi:hypothetical protein